MYSMFFVYNLHIYMFKWCFLLTFHMNLYSLQGYIRDYVHGLQHNREISVKWHFFRTISNYVILIL
jgi:hypothetical protein